MKKTTSITLLMLLFYSLFVMQSCMLFKHYQYDDHHNEMQKDVSSISPSETPENNVNKDEQLNKLNDGTTNDKNTKRPLKPPGVPQPY